MLAGIKIDKQLLWILLLIFIIHLPVIFNDFHTDDYHVLVILRDGINWQTIKSMDNAYYFRPVTNIFLIVRYLILGKSSVLSYILNILLHLIAVTLLYKFTKDNLGKSAAIIASLFFGIYFQHFEAVLWLYGIARMLAAIALLVSLINLRDNINRPSFRSSFFGYLFFALGLFCAEDFLPLTLFFVVYSFFSGNASVSKRFLRSVGFLLVSIFYIITRFISIGNDSLSTPYAYLGGHIIRNFFSYIQWLVAPQLSHPYIQPALSTVIPHYALCDSSFQTLSLILFLGITIWILWRGNRFEKLMFLLLFVSLAAALISADKISTRLVYLPSAPFAILAGSISSKIYDNVKSKWKYFALGIGIAYLLVQAVAINLTIMAYKQTQQTVGAIMKGLESLKIDWQEYDYVFLKNIPGRARVGNAFDYKYGPTPKLYETNQAPDYQFDIQKEISLADGHDKEYIVIDFTDGAAKIIAVKTAAAGDTGK